MSQYKEVDENLLERIHASYDEEFSRKLSTFLTESGVSNGTALQACANAIAQSLAVSAKEDFGCELSQLYGVYIHRLLHHIHEIREQKDLPPNVVPLKKKT